MNLIAGFEAWSEIELLTGTIYGEASGETTAGKIGVGMTIRTRALNPCWWGHNWREVILLDKQFTCWADHNRARIRKGLADQDPAWKICSRVARDIYAGNIVDKIGGPTNYHEEGILPRWTRKMKRLAHIGAHIFYRDLTVQIKVMP